jgi:hypothetical protein
MAANRKILSFAKPYFIQYGFLRTPSPLSWKETAKPAEFSLPLPFRENFVVSSKT